MVFFTAQTITGIEYNIFLKLWSHRVKKTKARAVFSAQQCCDTLGQLLLSIWKGKKEARRVRDKLRSRAAEKQLSNCLFAELEQA